MPITKTLPQLYSARFRFFEGSSVCLKIDCFKNDRRQEGVQQKSPLALCGIHVHLSCGLVHYHCLVKEQFQVTVFQRQETKPTRTHTTKVLQAFCAKSESCALNQEHFSGLWQTNV